MFRHLLILLLATLTFSALGQTSESDLKKEKRLSQVFLEKMANEKNAQLLRDGVIIKPILELNTGDYAYQESTIYASYHLSSRLGKEIETSLSSDNVLKYDLGKLINCWKIAVPEISVGSVFKVSCPSDTAYGDKGIVEANGRVIIKGGAALVFRIALHKYEMNENLIMNKVEK